MIVNTHSMYDNHAKIKYENMHNNSYDVHINIFLVWMSEMKRSFHNKVLPTELLKDANQMEASTGKQAFD